MEAVELGTKDVGHMISMFSCYATLCNIQKLSKKETEREENE